MQMPNSLARAILDALRTDEVALDELRVLIAIESSSPPESDSWMTARDAAAYLGYASLHPLYKLTSENAIPFVQDGEGCRLFFKRSELDHWRRTGEVRVGVSLT
jgi:excisionase family DNA binding protein